jgi:hypothetical protein
VQIARAAAIEPAPKLDVRTGEADVVAPARLFSIARIRFDSALTTLEPLDGHSAPSAIATTIALDQVQQGIGALRAVLVPSTSYALRRDATAAIDDAQRAIPLLRRYQQEVAARGDGPFDRDSLAPVVQLLHRQAVDSLEQARLHLR